jgi:DNA-directed RNA polymerase specialized sigma subunit
MALEPIAGPEYCPLHALLDQDREQRLYRAVRQLTFRERFLVQSRYRHEHTFEWIGLRLGVSAGTARSMHSRIMPRLRAALAREGITRLNEI